MKDEGMENGYTTEQTDVQNEPSTTAVRATANLTTSTKRTKIGNTAKDDTDDEGSDADVQSQFDFANCTPCDFRRM